MPVLEHDNHVSIKKREAVLYGRWRDVRHIHPQLEGEKCVDYHAHQKISLYHKGIFEHRINKPSRARIIARYYPKIKTTEELFFDLARNWKIETSIYSIAAKKYLNSNYLGIIGMGVSYGEPIIKLILEDLKKNVEYWHFALLKITDQNPVPKEDISSLKKTRDAWLKWGIDNNYIS
jgi:hypothetical protein